MSIETPDTFEQLPIAVIKSMIALSSSGFGVVVALAWNEVIRRIVADFIDPYLGKGSGFLSVLIYAVLMTMLAVVITMQLTRLQRQAEQLHQRLLRKNQPLL